MKLQELTQEFCKYWCKREHDESNDLDTWKQNILKLLTKEFHFIVTIRNLFRLNLLLVAGI